MQAQQAPPSSGVTRHLGVLSPRFSGDPRVEFLSPGATKAGPFCNNTGSIFFPPCQWRDQEVTCYLAQSFPALLETGASKAAWKCVLQKDWKCRDPLLSTDPGSRPSCVHRVPSSHVICIVTCGGDRKELSIEKVETGLEYSSGKGPGFDPLAPQKTEEARRGRKAERG